MMKLKAKYREVYYRDTIIGTVTYTVWAWYNFDSGYGIVKKFKLDHRNSGMTFSSDTNKELRPHDNSLLDVTSSKGEVHEIIDMAIRIISNAGGSWWESK